MRKTKSILRQVFVEEEDKQIGFVCSTCISDEILSKHKMDTLYKARICIGCQKEIERAISIERLASLCNPVLPQHFEIDPGHFPGYEMDLLDIIGQAIRCDKKSVLHAVAALLEDPSEDEDDCDAENAFYSPGQQYAVAQNEFDDEEHEQWYVMGEWHHVAAQLAHGRRFFNENARRLFDGILSEALGALSNDTSEDRAVVEELPLVPNSSVLELQKIRMRKRNFLKIHVRK